MVDLKKLRKDRKLSQRQIGDRIGCAVSTVSRYENGKQPIPYDMLCKLADLFGVSPSFIMESEIKGTSDLTLKEIEFIKTFRRADPRAQYDAYKILRLHEDTGGFDKV